MLPREVVDWVVVVLGSSMWRGGVVYDVDSMTASCASSDFLTSHSRKILCPQNQKLLGVSLTWNAVWCVE